MACTAQPKPREGTVFHWPGDDLTYRNIDHATCVKRVEAIRNYHLNHPKEDYCDIAYNLVACPHGEIIVGRGADKRSGANGNLDVNTRYGSVLFLIGQKEHPTDAQYIAAVKAAEQLGGSARKAHSEVRPGGTACPGDVIRYWIQAGCPTIEVSEKPVAPKPVAPKPVAPTPRPPKRKPVDVIAEEVIKGHWGNGDTRVQRLKASGYDPKAVQAAVNALLKKPGSSKTAYQVAQEVIQGKWGVGSQRRKRLRAAGYNWQEIQNVVNRLLK